jgi:hypothetical protein
VDGAMRCRQRGAIPNRRGLAADPGNKQKGVVAITTGSRMHAAP